MNEKRAFGIHERAIEKGLQRLGHSPRSSYNLTAVEQVLRDELLQGANLNCAAEICDWLRSLSNDALSDLIVRLNQNY